MEETPGSWGQLLFRLIGQFLLLRDFFGYFIPGLTFVLLLSYPAVVTYGFRIPTFQPIWLALLVAAVECYISGHFLAAAGHALQDSVATLIGRAFQKTRRHARRTAKNPLRLEPTILFYRALYPHLFIELDRRDTLALLRTGLGASFTIGCWLWSSPFSRIALLGVGMAFLLSGYAGRQHVAAYRIVTLRAAFRMHRRVPGP